MEEWQPIETAPKDGEDIIGYESGYGIKITWWDDDDTDCGDGGWRNDIHGWAPTHWVHLPKEPNSAKKT